MMHRSKGRLSQEIRTVMARGALSTYRGGLHTHRDIVSDIGRRCDRVHLTTGSALKT